MQSALPPSADLDLAATATSVADDPRNPSLTAAVVDAMVDPNDRAAREGTFRETVDFFVKLGRYVRPYKGRLIAGELAGIAFAVCNASLPLLTKSVFDHATAPSGTQALPPRNVVERVFHGLTDGRYGIVIVCAAIPVLMLFRGIFDYLNNYFSAWVSLRVLGDLRKKVFEHISSQSLGFFLQQHSGHLISRVANDTRIAQTALAFISTDLIKQPVCVIGGIIALLNLDWKFTLMSLVLFPACIVPVAVYGKRIRRSGRREEEQVGEMTVILQETFAGIRVIKSFAREDYQIAQFEQKNNEQFESALGVRKAMEIVSPMVEVVAAAGVGLALFYLHYTGIGLSAFFGLAMGMFFLYAPVKQISRMHMQIQKCRAATTNIFSLLDLQPTVVDAPDAMALTHCRGRVDFNDVSFRYESANARALDHFSLRVERGQTVALVGASGAGKSTVLALLQRFYDPAGGTVTIDGQDVRGLTQRSLRESIGMVTQDTFLFHDSIYENIRYGRLDASEGEIHEAARQAYIHDFILTLPEGYRTRVGDKGARLSGGQQQRLAIARALLKNAPILLLDEATSALDSESERMIQTALETLSKGKTVIAIAHRLSTILKADSIIVMDAGRIYEEGKHAFLYEKGGTYRRLYDLQFDHEAHLQGMGTAVA